MVLPARFAVVSDQFVPRRNFTSRLKVRDILSAKLVEKIYSAADLMKNEENMLLLEIMLLKTKDEH